MSIETDLHKRSSSKCELCGSSGSIRSLSGLFLQLSLAGILLQMFHAVFMSKLFEVFGPGALVMPVMVLVIAIYLVLLAMKAKTKRWTS